MEKMHPVSYRTLIGCLLAFGIVLNNAAAQGLASALPHFEFAAPTAWGWQQLDSKDPAIIVFTSQRDSAFYRITLLEREILDRSEPGAGTKEIAEHYMQAELSDMVEKGVQRGLYQLLDVEHGEEVVGGRLYYTMKYKTMGQTHYQTAALYLHFPLEQRREYFLVGHYSAAAPARELIAKPFEADFLSALESVAHSPVGSEDADGAERLRVITSDFRATFGKVHALTQMDLPLEDLQVRCRQKAGSGYVTFVALEGGILLAVFSSEAFDDPAAVIRLSAPVEGLPSGTTMDWGYVLDRNADGAVDYLAFLDGPAPMAPADRAGDLPDLRKPVSGKALREIIIPNIRLLFWHLADENFDRRHDLAATSARNLDNGWIDSWVVTHDADFDGVYESCGVFDRQIRVELGRCEGDATGYRAPGRKLSGVPFLPPGPDNRFLESINRAAEGCHLSGVDFRESRK